MNVVEILNTSIPDSEELPLLSSKVMAGFPSPADDHIDQGLDLSRYLINRPSSTFFVRVSGDSMKNAGIFENDILIVDKSLEAIHGKIVIAAVDNELTVKRLHKKDGNIMLLPENEIYQPIIFNRQNELVIWGVVTAVIRKF